MTDLQAVSVGENFGIYKIGDLEITMRKDATGVFSFRDITEVQAPPQGSEGTIVLPISYVSIKRDVRFMNDDQLIRLTGNTVWQNEALKYVSEADKKLLADRVIALVSHS